MDLKKLKQALLIKAKRSRKRLKGASKSYVSLFVIVTLVVVGTLAWFTAKDQIGINSPLLEFNSSSGIHDSEMQTLQDKIEIPYFRLEEASSVDGRNIYFPSSFFNNPSDAADATVTTSKASTSSDTLVNWTSTNSSMKTQTLAMRFREGNAGDKNVRYAYGDADINSAGGETKVWVKGYKVVIGDDVDNEAACNVYHDKIDINSDFTKQTFYDPYTCPVRIAIIDDSGHTPKVFDPSAKLADYVDKTYAVYKVNSDGTPTLLEDFNKVNLQSFASYYYGTDNPLFTIEAGHRIKLTVVAWLEGTHPYAKDFVGKEMSLSLEIETNVTQMEEIYLHDWTIGDEHTTEVDFDNYIYYGKNEPGHSWLSGDVNIAMQYYDTVAETYKTVEMTKMDTTDSQGHTVYKGALPNYVYTDISFYRLSKHSDDVYPGTVFNSWHTYGKYTPADASDKRLPHDKGVNKALDDLDSPAKGWRVLGNLRETRRISDSGTACYTDYYAIRGNGYNEVDHNANDRYKKWLSPCIGYWGTSSYPIGN